MWIRLRQICVACTDLNEVSRDLAGVLGLEACFTDPGVAQFGPVSYTHLTLPTIVRV